MPEWIVLPEDSGIKLITFLTRHLGDQYSARALKRAIEQNCCQVNERTERFASVTVYRNDYIQLSLENFTASEIHSFEEFRLLYEDDDLLIYNKPAGINSDEKGILHVLKAYAPHLELIHRLDRDTTGVLLFAKKNLVFEKMVELFRQQQVKKSYIAIVDGLLTKKGGTIENFLGKKHVYQGQTIWGPVSNPEKGLQAYTDWVQIKTGRQATLVHCFPKTGRTHQLRVHMAGLGHPILGDFQYGKQFKCPYHPPRYLLHAYRVVFKHPETGKTIDVQAAIPEDFLKAERKLFHS